MKRLIRYISVSILALAIVPFLADLQFAASHGKAGVAYAMGGGGGGGSERDGRARTGVFGRADTYYRRPS